MPDTVASVEAEIDKVSKTIDTEFKTCGKLVADGKALLVTHKKTHDASAAAMKLSASRVTALTGDKQWTTGANTTGGMFKANPTPLSSEDLIAKDAKFMEHDAALDKHNKAYELENVALETLKKKLEAARKELGMSVGELEEYLEDIKKVRGKAAASAKEKKAVTLAQSINKYVEGLKATIATF